MKEKRISIRLDENIHTALKYIAIEDKTSLQEIFVDTVKEKYFKRIIDIKNKEKVYNNE